MNFRRILGIIITIIGIALILISMYIKGEVREGKGKISRSQEQVDQGKEFFDLNPFSKPIGEGLTESAQGKIDQGRRDVAKYEELSKWLMNGGIALIVLGIILVVIRGKKHRK